MIDPNDKTPGLAKATEVSKAFSRTQSQYSTPSTPQHQQILIGLVMLAALEESGYD